jgi:hypothetical protein
MAKRCRRDATQAFDLWSWWKAVEKQSPAHYEVCDKHATLFGGSFDATASEKVREKCGPGVTLTYREAMDLRTAA